MGKRGDRDEIKDVDGGLLQGNKRTWILILGPASNLPYNPTALCVLNDKSLKWV